MEDAREAASRDKLVVWQFCDGKRGHESQSEGLLSALARRTCVEIHPLQAAACRGAIWAGLFGRFPPGRGLPAPDLIVGAGHATHWPMLAARRCFGGRIVVLMRPTLPLCWFDFAVVPEHDTPPDSERVMATRGVLNLIKPSNDPNPQKGLVLLGGPSRHHDWDDAEMIEQLKSVFAALPDVSWTLTNSRRTPATTLPAIERLEEEKLTLVPHQETPSGWVPAQLAECGHVWVSEDSVSMLFEALTAGAGVGLLHVPSRPGTSRVVAAVERLKAEGSVSLIGDRGLIAASRESPLAEADRVADWLMEKMLPAEAAHCGDAC